MKKIPMSLIAIGAIMTLAGIYIFLTIDDRADETFGDGALYEGADGEMEIAANYTGWGLYVHIESTYEGGGEGGYNENHGNNTWNLTESDCNLVKTFTLTHNEEDTQVFFPRCNYIDDDGETAESDDWIVVGTLCRSLDSSGDDNRSDRCTGGTYTWDTGGREILVYDLDTLLEGFFVIIVSFLTSLGISCCGSILLLVGIILAFIMKDNDKEQWATAPGESVSTPEPGTGWDNKESSWSEKKDYIRNDEDDGD